MDSKIRTTRLVPGFGLVAVLGLALTPLAPAQVHELDRFEVDVRIDSKDVENRSDRREVIYATAVQVPDASWLRLRFGPETALGVAPPGGEPTVLRVTSLLDNAVQHLRAEHLGQWRYSTAYFNGGALLVEIVTDPGASESRVEIVGAIVGPDIVGGERTVCGPNDDRELSNDPRTGRLVPIGCTAWLINDENHCFLTAGHCTGSTAQVMEFNVPLSNANGSINHPGPEDQYAVDPVSMQTNGGGGVGNDWAYFGCFANTETGLTPFETQGDFFVLAEVPPPVSGQDITIAGYGTTSPPVPNEWNQAQKTHTGPYATFSGTTVQYQTDTTGGNSGSPVLDETTGQAIGIHTHGGCDLSGGANSGTGSNHPGLREALANPRGVCEPLARLAFEYPSGLPELIDPAGAVLRVVVAGQNDGEPAPGTGELHYDAGDGFVAVPMEQVEANVYDAVFPTLACGRIVRFYVSAETTDGESVTDPRSAPGTTYRSIAALRLEVAFEDDFETDTGWTIENENLDDGPWERGVPAGGGTRGDPATDYDGSGVCFVTDNVAGNSDVDGGPTRIVSPRIDLADVQDPIVSYARWFTNDDGDADRLDVHISNDDGGSWTLVASVPNQFGWQEHAFAVAEFLAPTGAVRLRFSATDNPNDSVTEAGIDGVRVVAPECEAGQPGDIDGDGDVDVADLLALLAAWGDCEDPPAECPADFNGDGVVDIGDLLVLLASWS